MDNKENKVYLGCDVNCDKNHKYFLGSCEKALSLNATAFMIVSRPNRFLNPGTDVEEMFVNEGYELLKQNHFNEETIAVHAPYFIEIADVSNKEKWFQSREELLTEIRRTDGLKIKYLVLHPGKFNRSLGKKSGFYGIICALNYALKNSLDTNVVICLETMAGKVDEIGGTFEDLETIIHNVNPNYRNRLCVCLDTCHISDAGYNAKNVDEILTKFDSIIGLDKLKIIHINDSKFKQGSHMDRHEHIGLGNIGFSALYEYVHHPKLKDVPKIIETSQRSDLVSTYKREIQMLRDNDFDINWLNILFKDY